MQARFIRFEWDNPARTIGSVYLKPDKPYYFTAGQYCDITVVHEHPDHRGLTRTMTLSSAPRDSFLRFTMKFSGRNSSFKKALQHTAAGTPITVTDAMGDMVLPLDASIPLVFVAGGLGIASYISMIQWLTANKDKRDITLLYAVRNIDDIIFQAQFDAYAAIGNLKKVLYTTDHKADALPWKGNLQKARLTSGDIVRYAKPEAQVYLSGSQSMIEQLQQELIRTHKIPQYRLAFDYFEGYNDL